MKKEVKLNLMITGVMFVLFAAFTALVMSFDVGKIGPKASEVGFSTVNLAVKEILGTNNVWYIISEIFGVVALVTAAGFAIAGVVQLIQRKNIKKVDIHLIILGFVYITVIVFYIIFELVTVNYRPVLVDGALEASYPSSHTLLVYGIMIPSAMAFWSIVKIKPLKIIFLCVAIAITAVTVVGRLLSGVHWFTDIVGGVLLSNAVTMLYVSLCSIDESRQ